MKEDVSIVKFNFSNLHKTVITRSSHALRKMPRSPRLAHKASVMQASIIGVGWYFGAKEPSEIDHSRKYHSIP